MRKGGHATQREEDPLNVSWVTQRERKRMALGKTASSEGDFVLGLRKGDAIIKRKKRFSDVGEVTRLAAKQAA